jgi:hypothetical protein
MMKQLLWVMPLLIAAPALAVTADGASVGARALVTVDGVTDTQSISANAPGAPASLSSAASAALTVPGGGASAFMSVRSTWASSNQGQVNVNWGWQNSAIGDKAGLLDTRTDPGLNWVYNFTTGSQGGSFNANWNMTVVGGEDAFGLNGIYGSGGLPQFITPFTATPVSGAGNFSVLLQPFTSYSFGLLNYGNITGAITDRNASALFTMDWSINGGGNAIPEPASWAMLIAGFGLIGAVARRRRRVLAI